MDRYTCSRDTNQNLPFRTRRSFQIQWRRSNKYHMDQNGLQPRDLIPFIGGRNRVHEVLNRRRSLTLKMIWRLHEGLGIPAESLIKAGQARAA